MKRAVLCYNPSAGRFPSRILTERAGSLLVDNGWEIELYMAVSGEDITRLAVDTAQKGYYAFVVVGGDGSINYALSGLANTGTALGVLPAGTSNVFAQELGMSGLSWTRLMALQHGAEKLLKSEIHSVDVGDCNGRKFLMWASAGLDAFIVNRLEPRRRWEKHFSVIRYGALAIWNSSIWEGMKLRVSIDDRRIEDNFLLAVISNIHLYAGGLAILSPKAKLNDGTMDLWLFKGDNLASTVNHAWNLLNGTHDRSEAVTCYPFNECFIESDRPFFIQVDGEPTQAYNELHIKVNKNALNLLIPESTVSNLIVNDIPPKNHDNPEMVGE